MVREVILSRKYECLVHHLLRHVGRVEHLTGLFSVLLLFPELSISKSFEESKPTCHNERQKTHTPQLERSPCTVTRHPHASMKIPPAATKTRHSQKNSQNQDLCMSLKSFPYVHFILVWYLFEFFISTFLVSLKTYW